MAPLLNHILSLILLTPLAGALAILLAGRRRTAAVRGIAVAAAGLTFLASIPLWFLYEPHGKTWQFAERGSWIPSIGASYYVGVDGFSILLILLTSLVFAIAILASWNEITERVPDFHLCLLVLQTATLGAFMALDFLLFFLCAQIVLVAMGWLIGGWGGDGRRRSTIRFLVHTGAGSVLMLAGILVLYFYNHESAGFSSFDITHYHNIAIPFDVQWWVFLAFFLAFAINVPLIPLHTWVPDAQVAAPTAGSIVLAAVMLKLGTYGFIRFSLPILPEAARHFAPMIATLAVAGIIYGGVMALVVRDWKRVIAYATVSQMALMMLGMLALTPAGVTGSIALQIGHGLSAAALFLIAGVAYERRRRRELSEYAGLWRSMPVLAMIFLVVTVTSIGVLALNGPFRTSLIVDGTSIVSRWWAAAAVAGILLGAGFLVWSFQRTMFGRTHTAASAPLPDVTIREASLFVPLIALAAWIAVYPAPVLRLIETSVGRVVARANPVYRSLVAQGSDCATPAPPQPAGPPPEFLLVESCADGSTDSEKPASPAGGR